VLCFHSDFRLTLLRRIAYVLMGAIPTTCFISIVFSSWFVFKLTGTSIFLVVHMIPRIAFLLLYKDLSSQNQNSP
jgi:hypothetical protein